MTPRPIALALALGLALPALAQDPYQDDDYGWSEDGSYNQAPQVDVNVDMGAAQGSPSFDTFRDGLAPYGEWVQVNGYGYVWRPANVAAGWRPYYYGRWEWTDEGWLWVSDEAWGWATYHYGRWTMDPAYGWVWVPGYQWAPAWVSWRYSPDYVGWAPLAPGYSIYVSAYPVSYAWWSFVPCHRFVGYPVYSVAYTGGYARGIYHATQPAPPRASVYGAVAPAWGGPARPFMEHRIGRAITPVRVQPVASPGAVAGPARAGVVPVYRPEVRAAPVGRPSAAAPGPGRAWGSAPAASGAPRGYPYGAPRQYAPAPQGAQRQYAPAPQGAQRQYAPVQRYAPAPQGAPRQYAPAPQGAPRQYAPGPQGAPRQSAPAPQGAPRSYAPGGGAPRSYAPAGGGAMRAPAAAPRMAAPRAAPAQGGGAAHGGWHRR